MQQIYDKEKIINLHFDRMKELEETKHKNIMEEIKELKKSGIEYFHRGDFGARTKNKPK